jgi:DNA-binding beta-propeller fold protein YncE
MDETSLRARLELAVSDEPPLGPLVIDSLSAGRRLRRRRRATAAASLSAAAVVVAGVVPAVVLGGGHEARQPRPTVTGQTGEAGTAYIATSGNTVVPVSLATNTAGTPIQVPTTFGGPFDPDSAASPNGRTVYQIGMAATRTSVALVVTPIDTAANTAGPRITLKHVGEPDGIAVAPDGKTAYVCTYGGIIPINTLTDTQGTVIGRGGLLHAMTFAPNGKTLYVLDGTGGVTEIRTATNTVVAHITVPGHRGLRDIAITPNGKTAYVATGTDGGPDANVVVPIDLATNKALAPITIAPAGATGLSFVMAPDGRTAYVLSSRAVTPINTVTNQAEPYYSLPESDGNSYYMLITPNGKTLYVLTPRGVVPIRTATGKVLPIIGVPKMDNVADAAFTPDGRTIYVGAVIVRRDGTFGGRPVYKQVGGGVVPISTVTNTAGPFINLGDPPVDMTFAP